MSDDKNQQSSTQFSRLSALSIKNFKAFGEEVHIPIKPITLIFGQNSSGKSSILHSLLYINELQFHTTTYRPFDIYHTKIGGDAVDLGGYPHYIHTHNPELPMQITLTINNNSIAFNLQSSDEGLNATVSLNEETSEILTGKTTIAHDVSSKSMSDFELDHDNIDFTQIPQLAKESEIVTEYLITTDSILINLYNIIKDFINPESERFMNIVNTVPLSTTGNLSSELIIERLTQLRSQFSVQQSKYYTIFRERFLSIFPEESIQVSVYSKQFTLTTSRSNGNTIQSSNLQSVFEKAVNYCILEAIKNMNIPDKETQHMKLIHTTLSNYSPLHFISDVITFESIILQKNTLNDISNTINAFTYLGPIRHIPDRSFVQQSSTNLSISDGSTSWYNLLHQPMLIARINSWMQQLGINYQLRINNPAAIRQIDFEILTDYLKKQSTIKIKQLIADLEIKKHIAHGTGQPFLQLIDEHSNTTLSHRDVGIGISQVLPIVITAFSENAKTIMIEQPELHLHPRIQGDLADLFIETALKGPQQNTYILETHSEHIIRRLMRRVREGVISESDVSILYVDRSDDGSIISHLRLDSEGDFLDEWPNGFFEEGFNDTLAGR